MKNEKLILEELNFTELEDINGGFILEAIAIGLTIVGGIYYLGTQCAAYDQRHGY